MDEKIIAIIPARSGSKGLPDKNIKELYHKPLLVYSIEAAHKSGLFDVIHVSTDSNQYSEIAAQFGADQPFLRDKNTAEDNSSTWDAVREVLKKYNTKGKQFDVCILLQPTSPLRTAEDIKFAYELFRKKNAASVVSVTEVDHPVQWCFTLDNTHLMDSFANSAYKNARRQELEKHYRENGAIYIARVADIMKNDFDIYSADCYAYIMDRIRSVDIDTMEDFKIAEVLMQTSSEGVKFE